MLIVYMLFSYVLYTSAKNRQVFSFTAFNSTSQSSNDLTTFAQELARSPQFYGNPYVDSLQHSRYIDSADSELIDANATFKNPEYRNTSSSLVRCAYGGSMTGTTLLLDTTLVTTLTASQSQSQHVYWHFAPLQVQICMPFTPGMFKNSLVSESTYLTKMGKSITRVCTSSSSLGTYSLQSRYFQLPPTSTSQQGYSTCTTSGRIVLTYAGSYPVVSGHIYKAEFHPVLRLLNAAAAAAASTLTIVPGTYKTGDEERLPQLKDTTDQLRRMGVYGKETIWTDASYPVPPSCAPDDRTPIPLPYDELLFVEILRDNLMVPVWSGSCDGEGGAEDPPLMQCFPPSTWRRGSDYRFVRLDELSFRSTYYYQGGNEDSTVGMPYSTNPTDTITPPTTSACSLLTRTNSTSLFVNMSTEFPPASSLAFVNYLGPWIYVVSDSDPTMVPYTLLAKGVCCIPLVKINQEATDAEKQFGTLTPYNMGVMLPPDFHSVYNQRCITNAGIVANALATTNESLVAERYDQDTGIFYLSPTVSDTYNIYDVLYMQSTYTALYTGFTASMVLVVIGMLVVVIGGAIAYFKDNHNWLREGENPIDALERAASTMWKNANESSLLQFLVPTKILLAFVLMIVLYQAFEATDMPYMVLCLMLPLMSSFFIVSMQYNDQADALKTSARSNLFATLLTVVVLCTLLSSMLSNASSTMRTMLTTVIIAATLYYCFIAQWYESQMHEVNGEEFFG